MMCMCWTDGLTGPFLHWQSEIVGRNHRLSAKPRPTLFICGTLGRETSLSASPPIGALLTLWSSDNVEEDSSAIVELWLGIRKALQSQNLKGFVLPQSCRHLFTVCLCPQYVATLVFVLVRPFLRQLTLRCFPLPDTPPHWSARPTVIGYEPPPQDFANYLDQQVIRLGPTGNQKKLTITNMIKPL